jgi:hypothetical protein
MEAVDENVFALADRLGAPLLAEWPNAPAGAWELPLEWLDIASAGLPDRG